METFELQVTWTGTTTVPTYSRAVAARAEGKAELSLSSAPGYGGDPACWNPEDLFGASLATCHLLTFLSLAKKFGVDVRRVDDAVTVTLDTVDRVVKITKVRLAPRIHVAAGAEPARVKEVYEKAHRYCFVANSITSAVELVPEVVVDEDAQNPSVRPVS